MGIIKYIGFTTLLLLVGCGESGDKPLTSNENHSDAKAAVTIVNPNGTHTDPIVEISLANQAGEVRTIKQQSLGKDFDPTLVVATEFINASGSLRTGTLGIDNSTEGNFTLGLAAEDPDGLVEVGLYVPSVTRSVVLCSNDCESNFQVTLTGINPALFEAAPGALNFELYIVDTLGNLVIVDSANINWQPLTLPSLAASRADGIISVSWDAEPDLQGYNLYASTQQEVSSVDILDLENGIQLLAITGNTAQFIDADPSKEYHLVLTGINSEGESGSSEMLTLPIPLSSENIAPIAQNDTYEIDEDEILSVNLVDNDSDVNGQKITLVDIVESPQNGLLEFDATGKVTYTPKNDFHGEDRFIYQITDSGGATAQANVLITILAVNDNPVVQNDTFTLNEDKTLIITFEELLINDSDIEEDEIIIGTELSSQPSFGSVVVNDDGSFTYTANREYIDSDSFDYQVTDANGGSGIASVFVLLNTEVLVNDEPPLAIEDSYQVNEDETLIIKDLSAGVLANDSHPTNKTIEIVETLSALPANGLLNFATDGTFTYMPNSDFFGSDSFKYQIIDSSGLVSETSVSIDVLPQQDAPIANSDSYDVNEDTALEIPVEQGVLVNDIDIDLGNLTADSNLVNQPLNGRAVLQVDGSFVYTPNSNFFGIDSFEYQISNDSGLTSTTQVSINVININDSPLAVMDSYITDEDTTLHGSSVLLNDSDVEGDTLTLNTTVKFDVTKGVLTLEPDGTFTYIPFNNSNGEDSFTYLISDGNDTESEGVVTIAISPINDAPVANNDTVTINEDTMLNGISVLLNDVDVDGDSLIINTSPVIGVNHGSLALNSDGSYTYTPDMGYFGEDSFTYQIFDAQDVSSTAIVSITINSVNDAPIAVADNYVVDEDDSLNGLSVLLNDSDPDGDTLIFNTTPISDVSKGTLSLFSDGTFTYFPFQDSNGVDSFIYSVSDGKGGLMQATANITINPVNDPSVAMTDFASLNEDSEFNGSSVLLNDTDVDGDMLTVETSPLIDVSHGSLTLNTDGTYIYTPNADYFGEDSFTYQLLDGEEGSVSAEVKLTILSLNDIPITNADDYIVNEDTLLIASSVLLNDSDIDGDNLTVNTVPFIDVSHGDLTLLANGSFTYQADVNYNGLDTFTYQVDDGQGGVQHGVVNITVNAISDGPIAENDSYLLSEDGSINISAVALDGLLINDSHPDDETFTISTFPVADVANGELVINSDGSFTYTPNEHFSGADSFTYQINDQFENSAQATVNLTVTSMNDAPVANTDNYTMTMGFVLSAPSVLVNDIDFDEDSLSIDTAPIISPVSGSLVLSDDGTFTYTPISEGVYDFTYQVNDGNGESDTAQVTITVNSSNTAPVGVDDVYNTSENHVLTATSVLVNDTDLEGNSLSVNPIPIEDVSNGILSLNNDGTFIYTPTLDFVGSDSFIYELNDGNDATSTAIVNLNVNANTAPVAQNDFYNINEDSTLNASSVLNNDLDSEGDPLTINTTAIIDVSNGSLLINADGTFDYTPNSNFTGVDNFTYQIDDGSGGTHQAVVSITMASVNDMPETVGDMYNIDEDEVLNGGTVLANDSDVDGDNLSISGVAISSTENGDLVLNTNGTFIYTPNLNFIGSDSFTYLAIDPNGGSAQGIVNITVNSINDDPIALTDNYSVDEDTVLSLTSEDIDHLLSNDTDIDGDTLTVDSSPSLDVSNGSLILGNDGAFTYTPDPDFYGLDSFVYQVTDGNGGSITAAVNINVLAINDAPIAADDAVILNEDSPLEGSSVLLNDSDIDGDALMMITVPISSPSHGDIELNSDGTYNYTPEPDFNGVDSFVYQATDGNGSSSQATVTLTINPINDDPIAGADNYTVDEDSTLTKLVNDADQLLANDIDIDIDDLTVDTNPVINVTNGSLTLSGDGSFVYTPSPDFSGIDTFTYQVLDGNDGSNEAVVTISVTSINDKPNAINQSFVVDEAKTHGDFVGTVEASDIEADNLSFAITGGDSGLFNIDGSSGTLTVNGVTPFNFENQIQHSLNVEITDDGEPSQSTVISITINVQDLVESVIPTEQASFGTSVTGYIELTGSKQQSKIYDSYGNGTVIYFVGSRENLDQDIYIVAYDNSGALDTSFGKGGEQVFDFGQHEVAKAITEKNGDFYLAFESYNGEHTEVCFFKISSTGDINLDAGGDGVQCTDEKSTLLVNDLISNSSTFFAVGSKTDTDSDSLIIQFDDSFNFTDHTPADPMDSPHIIQDISGQGLDDEAIAVFEPATLQQLITGSVRNSVGDLDIFAWLIDKDGVAVDSFNGGNAVTYDIGGFDDVVQAIGGEVTSNFTAHLAGYTVLSNGKKEAAILAIDNTGAVFTDFSPTGIETYDADGDAGDGTGDSAFTDIMHDSGYLYLSGTIFDGQFKQFSTKVSTLSGKVDSANYAIDGSGYRVITYDIDDSYALTMSLDNEQTSWLAGYRKDASDNINMVISVVDGTGEMAGQFGTGQHTITYSSSPTDDDPEQIIEIVNGVHAGKFLVISNAMANDLNDVVLTRYTSSGVLDTSFDLDGHKQIMIGSDVKARRLIEITENEFIIFGEVTDSAGTGTNGIIAKVDNQGNLLSDFGDNGIFSTSGISALNIYLQQISLDNLGNIVAVGSFDDGTVQSFVMRLNNKGMLDVGFNSVGYVTGSDQDTYNAVWVDGSNNLIVAGHSTGSNQNVLVAKYDSFGVLDSNFATSGKLEIDVNVNADDSIYKILADSNGDIYLLGSHEDSPTQFLALKITSTGSLISSFAEEGIGSFVMASDNGDTDPSDAIVDSNDNIIVVGKSAVDSIEFSMLGRITPDGQLDNTFNNNGYFEFSSCATATRFNSVLLLDDETLVVAGSCYINEIFQGNLDIKQFKLLEPAL